MDRRDDILALLQQQKSMTVEALCRALYCSPATVRRELVKLEKTGAIKRTRGGAVLRSGTNFDYSAQYRMSVNIKEKQAIAALAREWIKPGMTLFLDPSSTAECLCPFLADIPNLTVLTNGVSTALRLSSQENTETYIACGHIERRSNSVVGELAGNFIDNFRADMAFLSCRGVDAQGAYEANHQQWRVKQHMIRHAKSVILLCDSTKFGKSYFHRLGGFDTFTAVITDTAPDPAVARALNDTPCQLIY